MDTQPPVSEVQPPITQEQIPQQSSNSFLKIAFLCICAFLVLMGGYYVFFVLRKSEGTLTKSLNPTVTPTKSKGTITISNLTPPNFTRQQFTNLKLDKNSINTKAVPSLQSRNFYFIPYAFAETKTELPVYQVKRNHLSTDQAIAMAKEWGFTDTPIKNDIRNVYEYFLEWGTYSSQEGTAAIKKYGASGAYDKFDITLVYDPTGKYGVGPYSRSYLIWHRNISTAGDAPMVAEDEAAKLALDFLKSKNMLPEGEIKTNVVNKDDVGFDSSTDSLASDTLVYIERNIDGLKVIDGGVSMRPESTRQLVTIKGNTVIGLHYEEPMTHIDYQKYDILPVKTEKEAFNDLLESKSLAGKATFNNFDPRYSFEGEVDWSRNTVKDISISEVFLSYYRNENTTHEGGEYYQPIYVFKATGTVSGESFPKEEQTELTFFVPAVKYEDIQVSITPQVSSDLSPSPSLEASPSASSSSPN